MGKIKSNKLFTVASAIVLMVFLLPQDAFAQKWKLRRYEASLNIGTSQVFGDINGYPNGENWLGLKDINFRSNRPAFGFDIRYKLDPLYSVSLNTSIGWSGGTGITNDLRKFSTMIIEPSVRFEYFLITEERSGRSAAMFNRRGMLNNYRSIGVYVFAGIGAVYTKPKFNYRAGLSSEDPTFRFDVVNENKNFSAVVPGGVGIRYILNDQWIVGGELNYRLTFTDYIDGFTKNNGSSKHNDTYYFLVFKGTYRIKTTRRNIPVFLDRNFRTVRRSKRAI